MALSKFLYVPNLIGYTRIILMFSAYYFSDKKPILFLICYFLSQSMDMLDGHAARRFVQSTKFGAMLDMVTDRCSTIGLMMVIASHYPQYTMLCHFFIWLDIFSHWCHMLASLSQGSDSHKNVKEGPWLLRYYYKTKWFMVLLIIGAEGFPLALYTLAFKDIEPHLFKSMQIASYVFFPLFIMKHIINVIQFLHASIIIDEKRAAN